MVTVHSYYAYIYPLSCNTFWFSLRQMLIFRLLVIMKKGTFLYF